jgi:hypothetical protein
MMRMGLLHQDEGRACVDRHEPVEQLHVGVEDGAAQAQPGSVHERVDTAEAGVGCGHERAAAVRIRQLHGLEHRVRPGAAEIGDHLFAALAVAARHNQCRGTLCGEPASDSLAHTLGAAGDQRHLAVQTSHGDPTNCDRRTSPAGARRMVRAL